VSELALAPASADGAGAGVGEGAAAGFWGAVAEEVTEGGGVVDAGWEGVLPAAMQRRDT